jgi:uncharacterized protein (DUF1015 family)
MGGTPGGASGIGIRPADLYIVDPALARRVAAPAYDTLSPAVHARIAEDDPLNFLNVLRSPEDAGGDLQTVLRGNLLALQRLLRAGVFLPGTAPRFAWYRLAVNGHEQTALIAEVAVADYDRGRIARHEHTRADREAQLAAYLETVAVSSSPVALAYEADERMRATARAATAGDAVLRFTSADGVEHTVWTTEDAAEIAVVRAATKALRRLYITDGHHRFAAAARVAAERRAAGDGPNAPSQWLLAALFSSDELRILPFHRAVLRPRDVAPADLLAMLGDHVTVRPLDGPAAPERPHHYVVYLDGRWYEVAAALDGSADGSLASLDVVVLQQRLLAPVFGVREPRLDPRLRYIAGDAADVQAFCDEERAVGFLVRATTMPELMAIADAELAMPPKSTRFDPKARSGIFLRMTHRNGEHGPSVTP